MSEPPTLYEWAGGEPAIARLIDRIGVEIDNRVDTRLARHGALW